MDASLLLEVSKKIKQCRLQKKLTVQELAVRAGVSKGLISQIENGRSIPSLPVLFGIITALGLSVADFFVGMESQMAKGPVIIRKETDYEAFQKEEAFGFFYKRILVQTIAASTIDVVLLRLEPNSFRSPVQTAALEYKYILSGKVTYTIDGEDHDLNEGDSLFFNGRVQHNPKAADDLPVLMLIIYFFEEK